MNAIARKAAQIYAGSDWHKLSTKEKELVAMLESRGYLTRNTPANGFVGKIGLKLKKH